MDVFKGLICYFFFAYVSALYEHQHRPCSFNPLCTCSNGGPDLGSVSCYNVPLLTIPANINTSAIYIISLIQNELHFLEENSLNGTGLWKLQVNNNLLTDLPSNSLMGLENTLSILDLSKNKLIRIPKEAIQNLEKLQNLNLAGNHISTLHKDDLRGVSKTLKSLDLSENDLMHIRSEAFRNMVSLEVLNLASNDIISIDDITFQNGFHNLRYINLMNNQLRQIPLNILTDLKNIKVMNLNENLISSISEGRETRDHIYLDELHLEYNTIKELTQESFRLFGEINKVYLKGNPIVSMNDTFIITNVTEIHLPHCALSVISKNSFIGAMDTLKVLDLSYNDLSEFPYLPLRKLMKLSLAGNKINKIGINDMQMYGYTLKYLDIQGLKMTSLSDELMGHLPNIRELNFKKEQPKMNSFYLRNLGPSVERLHIKRSSLKIIENGAFQHLSGLKELDLSINSISKIGNATFKDVAHSLEKLVLRRALKMSVFPQSAISYLTKLQYLDVSSNQLKYLPNRSFTNFQNLKYLNLNHNKFNALNANFLSKINNPNLKYLKIAFNKITSLQSFTFNHLRNLVYLQLNDNMIKTIQKSSFIDMDSLININLEGNSINLIENEAFRNLPKVQYINIAYNKLKSFNLMAFDQVGRLSTLRIDVDHNEIQNLTRNYSTSHTSSNVEIINFSFNNISYINKTYFDPIRLSINVLDLSHNSIQNLTNLSFVGMKHLKTFSLSHNNISIIGNQELKGINDLQIFDISQNNIAELPSNLFAEQQKLRVFYASRNRLNDLPTDIFNSTVLEKLDLSYNEMTKLPMDTLYEVRKSLMYLDLQGNKIADLNSNMTNQLENLRHLNLADNALHLPKSATQLQLPKLISLDLAHNTIQDIPSWILNYLPPTLENLNLANISITSFPVLDACNLLLLNLSHNSIKSIQPGVLEKLKQIQILDISYNLLSTIYNNGWSNVQNLRVLYLDANPIHNISNNSFSNMEHLQELHIANLSLDDMQKDAFHPLISLRKIEMDTFLEVKNVNLSYILNKNFALQDIHLHVQEAQLEKILNDRLPKSLKKITIEGENLKQIDEIAFANIQSQDLTVIMKNTNITKLPQKLFMNMKEVVNFTAKFSNNKLQTVGRIISSNKEVQQINLRYLELTGNELNCDCKLAWIWDWINEYEIENGCSDIPCDKRFLLNLRESQCKNMKNSSIINAFKTELDCFSNRSYDLKPKTLIQLIVQSILLILFSRSVIANYKH